MRGGLAPSLYRAFTRMPFEPVFTPSHAARQQVDEVVYHELVADEVTARHRPEIRGALARCAPGGVSIASRRVA